MSRYISIDPNDLPEDATALRYTGLSSGSKFFYANKGRVYQAGNNDSQRVIGVLNEDVEVLMAYRVFEVVEPETEDEPTIEDEPVVEDTPTVEDGPIGDDESSTDPEPPIDDQPTVDDEPETEDEPTPDPMVETYGVLVAAKLAAGGITMVEMVEAATDETLLAIDGIGAATLEAIRNAG